MIYLRGLFECCKTAQKTGPPFEFALGRRLEVIQPFDTARVVSLPKGCDPGPPRFRFGILLFYSGLVLFFHMPGR